MNDRETLSALYAVVTDRKRHPAEGSYTSYLFEKGLDKILKKVGEESAEVIIAAKNGEKAETTGEIADLFYHVLVLMAEQAITTDELFAVLEERRQKIGNLKQFHEGNRDS